MSCKKSDPAPGIAETSLYSLSEFPVGVAVDYQRLFADSDYVEIVRSQFNSITPENIFKSRYLHPGPNSFDWSEADGLINFCTNNNQKVHGHTLIWKEDIPSWITDFQGSHSDWEALMKEHIQVIMSHFKGKVSSWDVVNEAFEEDGSLKDCIWKEKIGNDYIEKAFMWASEVDPQAFLFYNDYNLETNPTKRKAVLSLLNDLRDKGVRIDGIGLQMHVNIAYSDISLITEAMQEISGYMYKIHLSEIDISVNPFAKKEMASDPTLLDQQANKLAEIVMSYKRLPEFCRFGITFWGVSDKNSWIRTYFKRVDYPLLYDDDYQPKPVLYKLRECI